MTQPERWTPESPSQRRSTSAGSVTTTPGGRLSTKPRYQHGDHELVRLPAAEDARVALRPGRGAHAVGAADGEPEVVERALRAVGRLPAEGAAEPERRPEPLVADAHERVAEAVDAAVAPVPGLGLVAHGDRGPRTADVELRRDAGDEPVREPGRAAGVVRAREDVHQRRERDVVLPRVRAADRVHQPVAVREQEPALGPGGVADPLDGVARVVGPADERGERPRVAVAGLRRGEGAAAVGERRRGLLVLTAGEDDGGHRETDEHEGGDPGDDGAAHGRHCRATPRRRRAARPRWARSRPGSRQPRARPSSRPPSRTSRR